MPTLIDLLGLAPFATEAEQRAFAIALHLDGEIILDRLHTLAQLVNGAGYTILTGPLGADFWCAANPEVQVKVVPDGYQSTERLSTRLWGLIQAGFTRAEAAKLDRKPPTKRAKAYTRYCAGIAAAETLDRQVNMVSPLRDERYAVEIISVERAVALLNPEYNKYTGQYQYLALDWEWHRVTKAPVGLAISTATENFYCPVWGSDHPQDVEGSLRLREAFTAYARNGGLGVLHGGRADLGVMWVGSLDDPGDYQLDDSMVMAYLLGYPILNLKDLTRLRLGRDPIENDYEWAEQPVAFTARYAAAGDTRNTYDLAVALTADLKAVGNQWAVYEQIEKPLFTVVASMEREGTPVDITEVINQYRDHVAVEYGLRYAILENYGRDLANSTDHDRETRLFIVDCGFPDPGTVDQRTISLNQHWCIDLILEYRRTRTRRRGFLKKIITSWYHTGQPTDFRVYPRFNQAGSLDDEARRAPRSGRFSSADPNLTNQPREIRGIYVPPKGHKWWSYDYSGMELRIAADVSGDPVLRAAFVQTPPRDLHGEFRDDITARTGKDVGRPNAKTGMFEQLYEGGAGQLQRILAKMRSFLDMTACESIVTVHHQRFSVYHAWGQLCVLFGHKYGYAETIYGRRRKLLFTGDETLDKHEERASINHPIQGSGADIVKKAMDRVQAVLRKYGGHMCIMVHDELDGWVPENVDIAAFDREMKDAMTVVLPHGIVLLVEGGVKGSWKEAH